jgi:hypothetical protein
MLTKDIYGKTLSNSFNSAISAYAQKVKPRIHIQWLDSRHVDNLTVTTNSTPVSGDRTLSYYFSPENSMSGNDRQGFTWGVCDSKDANGKVITADGTWYAMPTNLDDHYKYGWWSTNKSQASESTTYNGYGFVTEPYVEYSFTQRKVNRIRVATSEFNGRIKDYTLYVYNQTLTLILQEDGTIPEGSYFVDHWVSEALATQNVFKIKVVVHSTEHPEDNARIQEVSPIYESDLTNYVISHSVERTRDLHETSLPIAGTGTSSASITLDNTNKEFNIFSSGSEFGPYMKKDLKITVANGWRIKKTDDVISQTQLLSSITSTSTTIMVKDGDIFPEGGSGNSFVIILSPNTQNEEYVLVSSKAGTRQLTVQSRGYANTIAKSHSANAVVLFDPYEYVHNGTFYVDEWTGSSSMQITIKANDWSKFLTEKQITRGFFLQTTTAGDAIENLLMMGNYPKADYKQIVRYSDEPKRIGAIAQYSFNEPTVDRSLNVVVPSTGLRARFWNIPNGKEYLVKDIIADAIDKQLSDMDKALGLKAFISPDYVALSKNLVEEEYEGACLALSDYEFTSFAGDVSDAYYNGVIDGFYIPDVSGVQELFMKVKNGGVRVFLDDNLIINEWFNHVGELTDASSSVSQDLDLDAGVPYKIRIEFFHPFNTYVYPTSSEITAAGLPATLYPTSASLQTPGNITLTNRPLVENQDGTISTLESISFNDGFNEVVIPTVINGVIVDNQTAKNYYISTGLHLGKFASNAVAQATSYAITLHDIQESWIDLVEPSKFSLEFWRSIDGTDELVPDTDCATIVAFDAIGSRNASPSISNKNANHHRNDAIYNNLPLLAQATGLVSEPDNKAVSLTGTSYIRIPYHSSLDIVNPASVNYTGSWSMEVFAKFPNTFSDHGEYLSDWDEESTSDGFAFFNTSSSHGFKIYTLTGLKTVSSSTPLSTTQFSHLLVTCDGSSIYYYVNGSLVSSVALTSAPVIWAFDNITIGGRGSYYQEYIDDETEYGEIAPDYYANFIIDEFAIYNTFLSQEQITNRYIATKIQPLTVFPFLYGNDNSIREIIDTVSLADFGRMYIEETDNARYDHFNRFFESSIDQHANVQASISGDTHITASDFNVQLQVNKVTVNIAGLTSLLQGRQGLWNAEDPTTLGVVTLTANTTSSSTSITVDTTDDPPFPKNGYLKIDNEIVKYTSITSNRFNGLERGQFDTVAASHTSGAKVREVKYYDIKYDKAPAFDIQSPFISAIRYEDPDLVEIHRFLPTAYGAELIMVASNAVEPNSFTYLQGTNPLTGEVQLTSIAGTPILTTEQASQVKKQSGTLASDIRKYGLKEIVIDNPYITDAEHATKIADFMISKLSEPVPILNINSMAMPKLQLGDKIRITSLNSLDIINSDYWVVSHSLSVGDSLDHSITLRKVV